MSGLGRLAQTDGAIPLVRTSKASELEPVEGFGRFVFVMSAVMEDRVRIPLADLIPDGCVLDRPAAMALVTADTGRGQRELAVEKPLSLQGQQVFAQAQARQVFTVNESGAMSPQTQGRAQSDDLKTIRPGCFH